MKIAIFHNFMDNIGGAEIVDLMLARDLKADIYTTNIDKAKIEKMGFSSENIFSIGKVPINAPFRQELTYWKFRGLNIEKRFKKHYDHYIIAGDWAMPAAIHNKPHIWYVFSPTREIWDLYEYVRENIVPGTLSLNKRFFDSWVYFRRYMNLLDSRKVMKIISISENVQKRVRRYLKRDSIIIHAPTEISKYYYKKSKGYWLSVNRLINHKRVDMQIRAFAKLPDEKLIIVGSYENSLHFQQYAKYIHSIKPENVEIKSWVSESELLELYANCKGLITTSLEEDYGMTPIEAMASGKAVIAPNEGGYKETIINGNTGILIDDIDEYKLVEAIIKLGKEINENPLKYKKACLEQAKKFDIKIFVDKIKEEIRWKD